MIKYTFLIAFEFYVLIKTSNKNKEKGFDL